MKKCAEKVNSYFWDAGKCRVAVDGGLIMAGSGPLKYELLESPFLNDRLRGPGGFIKKGKEGAVVTAYGGRLGFFEAVEKSSSLLSTDFLNEESSTIETLLEKINVKPSSVALGLPETIKAIQWGFAKTVILSPSTFPYLIFLGKQLKWVRLESEISAAKQEMLRKSNDSSEKIVVERTKQYFRKLCGENKVPLRVVGVHSPATQLFSSGFGGASAELFQGFSTESLIDESSDDEKKGETAAPKPKQAKAKAKKKKKRKK